MNRFIDEAINKRELGLALHYPLIYATVVGMNAQTTFEFGAGGSTRVFTDAHNVTGGMHYSISTAPKDELVAQYGITDFAMWVHTQGLSEHDLHLDVQSEVFDIVLHDGSHAEDVVTQDIKNIWPKLKRYGLLLVHDTQHSYVGAEMRRGVRAGLQDIYYNAVTLPFGFGLTIIRKEYGTRSVAPFNAKPASPHFTELSTFLRTLP